jgi:hypothetical protein
MRDSSADKTQLSPKSADDGGATWGTPTHAGYEKTDFRSYPGHHAVTLTKTLDNAQVLNPSSTCYNHKELAHAQYGSRAQHLTLRNTRSWKHLVQQLCEAGS